MNSLPDQFSAARLTQLDNGFNLMRSFSDQALDRTSRVLALQLDASRAAVEQSSNAVRQLLAARDARDLLALGSQSQQHLQTMLDFGRELFSIATAGMSVPMLPAFNAGTPQAPQAKAEQAAAEAFERIGGDTASAAAAVAATAECAAQSLAATPAAPADFALPTEAAEATPAVVTSDVEPQAEPTAIARAASEALDVPVAPPHPVAASMPVEVAVEIELPRIEPANATPPPSAGSTGPTETRGTKGRKKQH